MSAPTPLVLVGTGEYYQKILVPALTRLMREGIAKPILTLDIKPREDSASSLFSSVPHRVRKEGEKLSHMLRDVLPDNPVVILGHANHLHVDDAEDLHAHGFRVLIEKPYTRTLEELSRIEAVIEGESPRVGLIEYYLTMKAAPLFACTGHLKRDSFFIGEKLLQKEPEHANPVNIETIGEVTSITVDVLEGEGLVGRVDHRGAHLISRAHGGGMIHDLGIHAIAPLIPLEEYIGELLPDTLRVQTAHSKEYVEMAEELFGIPRTEVAESYAEISLTTTQGIPVHIRVGKYVCHNENRRALTLTGTDGSLILDLSNPALTLREEGVHKRTLYTLPKTEEKYYAVLRASLLELNGESPYSFSISRASLRAQALVLHAVALTEDRGVESLYDSGLNPEDIV